MATSVTRGPAGNVPGRYIVLAMLAFGVLSTAGIWTYWKLHLAPYLPLQRALIQAYPASSPRVEGGRHKDSPQILRLVLTIEFPPDEGDPRVHEMVRRILSIARKHLDFRQYDELEVYLVYRPPERSPQQYEYKRKMSDVLQSSP